MYDPPHQPKVSTAHNPSPAECHARKRRRGRVLRLRRRCTRRCNGRAARCSEARQVPKSISHNRVGRSCSDARHDHRGRSAGPRPAQRSRYRRRIAVPTYACHLRQVGRVRNLDFVRQRGAVGSDARCGCCAVATAIVSHTRRTAALAVATSLCCARAAAVSAGATTTMRVCRLVCRSIAGHLQPTLYESQQILLDSTRAASLPMHGLGSRHRLASHRLATATVPQQAEPCCCCSLPAHTVCRSQSTWSMMQIYVRHFPAASCCRRLRRR